MSKWEPSSEAMLEGGRVDGNANAAGPSMFQGDRLGPPDASGGDSYWIQVAQRCFRTSTDFFDASLRRKIIDGHAVYNSEHPMGSKYASPEYQKRSRLFVPKTRSIGRGQEAAGAVAFFGTDDVVTLTPANPSDPQQRMSARAQQEMVNYRLNTTVPWYQYVIGGLQDAFRAGFVIGATDWMFREGKRYFKAQDDAGTEFMETETFIAEDRPRVRLVPPENFRIDPGCDWMDPINSSPYLIEVRPMYVCDIKERMRNPRLNQGVKYRPLDDATLLAGLKHSWDTIRQKRERSRQDRYEQVQTLHDHMISWVHRTIVKVDGEDYVYETIGTNFILSEPVPLAQVDPRGYRGYIFGYLNMEAHNPFPEAPANMLRGLQDEANEVRNMRLDNTKLATYGRYMVRRGAQVDLTALGRFTPGSSVEVQDIQRDVRWDKAPEVGRGAYEEQDRLNIDMDELIGNFSQASQNASGRRTGDPTLGATQLLDANANKLSEFNLVTYNRTFVSPSLKQVVDLERIWETDDAIAAIVGERLGMDVAQVWKAMNINTEVRVNVGFGSTNGQQRVQRLATGLQTVGTVLPQVMMGADAGEIVNEVFGALGYRSGDRFFPNLAATNKDAKYEGLMQQISSLQNQLATKQPELDTRVRIATMEIQARVQVEQLRQAGAQNLQTALLQFQVYKANLERDLALLDVKIAQEETDIDRNRLYMEREALSNTIVMAEREFQLKVQTTMVAPPPHADVEQLPDSSRSLMQSLTRPASGAVALEAMTPGDADNRVGVVSRGRFGAIPFKAG